MDYKNLLVSNEGPLVIVTVNRPEVRNALNLETWREINAMVTELETDETIRVVIITGAGEKAFVAGADINFLKERSMLETFKGENQNILNRWAGMDKVTIAALNGFTLGGGLELALACDLRIASAKAKLGQPELNLGLLPGAGGTQRLSRLIGLGRAKELVLTGDIIPAQEALQIGLVNKVVAPEELMSTAREMAGKILGKGSLAVRFAKAVMNWGESTDLQTALTLERMAQSVLFGTEDHMEGINAFLEKRSPNYQGK